MLITVYAPRRDPSHTADVRYAASEVRRSAVDCSRVADSWFHKPLDGAPTRAFWGLPSQKLLDFLGAHPLTCDLGAKLQALRALAYAFPGSYVPPDLRCGREPSALVRLLAAQPTMFIEFGSLALELEDAGDGLYVSGPSPAPIDVGAAYWGTPTPARIPLREVLREIDFYARWAP